MSDDPTIPEQSSDEAPVADEGSPPPWGDDFDPARAWKTITHLREFETPAKMWQRAQQGDPEALHALGYEIVDENQQDEYEDDDTAYDPEEFEDPNAERLQRLEREAEEFRAFQQQQQAERAKDLFDAHLDELCGDQVKLSERERNLILRESIDNGFDEAATEGAFKAHLEWLRERDKQTVESYRTSKRAPHVTSSGQSATKQPNLDNDRERQEYMQERVRAMERD